MGSTLAVYAVTSWSMAGTFGSLSTLRGAGRSGARLCSGPGVCWTGTTWASGGGSLESVGGAAGTG